MGKVLMKKVIGIVVGVIVAGVGVVLAIAATKPDEFKVERSQVIQASAQDIYPEIDNYKNWSAWSPWEKLDPNMKRTYSGPPAGAGAVYEWDGNSKAGKGRMEITESVP